MVTNTFRALEEGDILTTALLIEKETNLERRDINHRTILMYLCKCGLEGLVHRCLELGANVHAKDAFLWTPLHMAVDSNHLPCVITLLEYGAPIDAKLDNGFTALLIAAFYGRADHIKVLLDAGADIDTKSCDGETALQLASANGDASSINILIDHGANVQMK